MPWRIRVRKKFYWAHYLTNYYGKPEPIHGHTWQVEVCVLARELDEGGIGVDFLKLKEDLENLLPDHTLLNEHFNFSPSAENLAKWIYEKLKGKYEVERVSVWETEDFCADYFE